jgi:hypothetical protein
MYRSDQARNINAWLNPDSAELAAQYAVLDGRHQPYMSTELRLELMILCARQSDC